MVSRKSLRYCYWNKSSWRPLLNTDADIIKAIGASKNKQRSMLLVITSIGVNPIHCIMLSYYY
ncbi:hypothetical protein BCR42DRAFT_411745 [Absidia repens]|uniref:Uncharacterized protein n=1 Tax=Absidia repens TaxID=90262 RepID=A0A1X2INL4_9FUNG|nr:hypothetical protein BCR42DRAFT_411745 [Absidia repens]